MEEDNKANNIKNRAITQDDTTWEDLLKDLTGATFVQELAETLEEAYNTFPTEVQLQTVDFYIQNKKKQKNELYLVRAPGGSGKTLSYITPALIDLFSNYKKGEQLHSYEEAKVKGKMQKVWRYHPKVIIFGDTRVLVEQITQELEKCIPKQWKDEIKITNIYTGRASEAEFGQFGHILVATPAIVNTLLKGHDRIYLDNTGVLIIDEAELVYDNGQEILKSIFEQYLKQRPGNADIIAVSATLTDTFKVFAQKCYYGDQNKGATFVNLAIKLEGVQQIGCVLPPLKGEREESQYAFKEMIKLLRYMYLEQQFSSQVMIFMDSIKTIDLFNDILLADSELSQGANKLTFDVIHSKMVMMKGHDGKDRVDAKLNNQRMTKVFKDFRADKFKLLLCTDIMARGIDIANVGLVINLFAPRVNMMDEKSDINAPKYMHRIARTGRYIQQGIALSYLRNEQSKYEIQDQTVEEKLRLISGLEDNKIEFQDIGKDYIQNIAEQVQKCVEHNKKMLQ